MSKELIDALRGKRDIVMVAGHNIEVRSLNLDQLAELADIDENSKSRKDRIIFIKGLVRQIIKKSLPKKTQQNPEGFDDVVIDDLMNDIDPSVCIEIFNKAVELSGMKQEKKE